MVDPAQNIANVVKAYNQVANAKDLDAGMEARDTTQGGGFAELVKGALKQAEIIGQQGEQQTLNGISDKADLSQVVTAVTEAEITLQTVVAVRDKVIDAYKEILRMPM